MENYYRNALPKQKLFSPIASDVFVSDARLLQIWKDTHDSAVVSRKAAAADSLDVLKLVPSIRDEITNGAKFGEVAKRESEDSVTAVKCGV